MIGLGSASTVSSGPVSVLAVLADLYNDLLKHVTASSSVSREPVDDNALTDLLYPGRSFSTNVLYSFQFTFNLDIRFGRVTDYDTLSVRISFDASRPSDFLLNDIGQLTETGA